MATMFYDELQYYVYSLYDARAILMTSFLSQKSISYLDLQLSAFPSTFSYARYYPRSFFREPFLLGYEIMFTEESFRNMLLPNRRLLYTLNLDFPEGREYSNLKNGPAPDSLLSNRKSLFVAIESTDLFFNDVLYELLFFAFKRTNCKLNLLKWMMDFRPLESVFIPECVQYSCARFLYYECVDIEFARAFVRKFITLYLFPENGELQVLEYLLYQSRLCDFSNRSNVCCCKSLTDNIVGRYGYRLVDTFLKYEATSNYIQVSNKECEIHCQSMFEYDLHEFRSLKFNRIRQIIDAYRNKYFYTIDASSALRLVWSSIPDCFITHQEMMDACKEHYSPQIISEAHGFYEEAIHQTVSCREPRALSHYCRTAIRMSLYNSKQWLPDGIKQLKLPPRVESFLNLQRDHFRPYNFGPDKAV